MSSNVLLHKYFLLAAIICYMHGTVLWVNIQGQQKPLEFGGTVTEGTNFLLQKSNSYGESKNLRGAMYGLLAPYFYCL